MEKSGGDFDSNCYATYIVEYGQKRKISLDLTRFLKYWLKLGANYGIILKRPSCENDGFGDEVENLINNIKKATVKVYYKPSFKEEERKTLTFFVPEEFSNVEEALIMALDKATISVFSPIFYQPKEIPFNIYFLKNEEKRSFTKIILLK